MPWNVAHPATLNDVPLALTSGPAVKGSQEQRLLAKGQRISSNRSRLVALWLSADVLIGGLPSPQAAQTRVSTKVPRMDRAEHWRGGGRIIWFRVSSVRSASVPYFGTLPPPSNAGTHWRRGNLTRWGAAEYSLGSSPALSGWEPLLDIEIWLQ